MHQTIKITKKCYPIPCSLQIVVHNTKRIVTGQIVSIRNSHRKLITGNCNRQKVLNTNIPSNNVTITFKAFNCVIVFFLVKAITSNNEISLSVHIRTLNDATGA